MIKRIVLVLTVGVVIYLIIKKPPSTGVSAPTAYPTSLYSTSLIT